MNLVADGHRVVVHDPDARRCGPLVAAGATIVAKPAEVAERSAITFTSLPTPAVMEAVARQWLQAGPPGARPAGPPTNPPAAGPRGGGARPARGGAPALPAAPPRGGARRGG